MNNGHQGYQNEMEKAYYRKRAEYIWKLRYERRLSYQEISEILNISKQRVQQIVQGLNAAKSGEYVPGRLTEWNISKYSKTLRDPDWMESHTHLTNKEIADKLGAPESTVSKYRRGTDHAVEHGNYGIWYSGRERVRKLLEDVFNVYSEPQGVRTIPHLVTQHGIRIEVRSSNPSNRVTNPNIISPQYRARFRGQGQVDFCVLVLNDLPEDYFVLPASIAFSYSDGSMCVCYPAERVNKEGIQNYHNLWSIIVKEEDRRVWQEDISETLQQSDPKLQSVARTV